MNIETFVPALAIILGAYFIRGTTGFGSGLIAVPLLALILPRQSVVPLVLVLDFCASLIMSHKARAHVQWAEMIPLLPTSLPGIIIGATLLVRLPRQPLLTALALFVILFGLRCLLSIHSDKPVSRSWSVGIERMLRIHFLQHWFDLPDLGAEMAKRRLLRRPQVTFA